MASNGVQAKKRISIELPKVIIEKLDGLARRVRTNRSELIRLFVAEKLSEKEKEEFERDMTEGYLANYDFIDKSSKEWDFTLKDGL
jgi:metal-responsive CopG/Arc/MetJ family transcriptional regulator